jgi:hypothetical protein
MSEFRLEAPWWVAECLEDNTPFRDFHITKGYGSGGTYGATMWDLELCFGENKHSPTSWVVAPTFAQIEDPIISTLAEILKDHYKLEAGEHYDLNISGRPKLTLPNGHTIRFKSAKRSDSLVAENISHVRCTEAGLYAPVVFERLTGRVRCPKAGRLQRMFEGTPEGMTAWETLANFPEGVDEKNNARRIIVETADNWRLPQGFLEKLQATLAHDPAKLISYTKGLFMPFVRGTAYWEFRESRDVLTKPEQPNEYSPLILGMDFNKWPLAWVCMQKFSKNILDYRREYYVQHGESDGKARGLLDALSDFMRQYPPSRYGHLHIDVIGDASGYSGSHRTAEEGSDYDVIARTLRANYRSVSINSPKANPRIKDRLNQHNSAFAYERYKLNPNQKNTIRSYQETRLKDGTWDIDKPANDDKTHWGDAAGYLLFEQMKGTDFENPIQRIYGINRN